MARWRHSGTPVVRTDAASIWATGVTWWQVPPVAKVVLKGKLSPGVVGKDVIIALCGLFNKDEVLNHAVEFVGDGVSESSDVSANDHREHDHGMGRARRRVSVR